MLTTVEENMYWSGSLERDIILKTFKLHVAQKVNKCSLKEFVKRSEESIHKFSSNFSGKGKIHQIG